jgi:AraC-like DNA-binding protein
MAAEERTDGCFDLEKTYSDPGTFRTLLEAANAEGAITALTALFTRLMGQHARLLDDPVTRAMDLIMIRKGDVDIADLRTVADLSARTFERRFKQSIGLPPLLFARIRRFQHTLALLREGRYTKLSDIAYAADYADQSHYIRSFKEFTGISPLEFIREGREVVENFVELPPG